ncbi:hypothetical protein LQ327_06040 [Actinomycetospora endophytica]|uniref:TrbL/VirB6 plasmid conjugal transfer protein n=1 Tax=Actinomycetospora endophytica TaxID=2291215 RepID=A0ABS8P4B5_9PSEU|nr:hypothetical protein [Actinomycetospora endophytica]MCD2192949.1 hypothetical protein [Actinomycetospora endophytica]
MIVVVGILVAALVIGWRRGSRRARSAAAPDVRKASFLTSGVRNESLLTRHLPRTRSARALLVVVSLVGGLILVGGTASAQAFDCKAPPDPDRPGTGLVGSLDPAPIGVGTPGSVYDEVGYAGQVWWTYDLGCGPGGARDPAAATDTWLGNQVFDVAKLIVGGVNWAHYLIARGSSLLTPLDTVIQTGTRAMYEAVFTTWAGVALAALAAIMLVLAMRGELAQQARRGLVAVLALGLAAAAYAAPIQWSRSLDGVLLDGVTAMQQGFLRQVGVGDQNTLPTVLTDQIVYSNWLRGEFGSADVPQARDLGRPLLQAQTFTKVEVATGQDGQAQADAKKQQFTDVANKVGDRYSYFQGRSGSRVGAGALALIQAACIALFQLMSKVLVLVSMLMIRLLVMVAPALAVVALIKPEVLPAMLRIGGAALVNTLLVGALAGLHSLLVISLFRPGSGVDTWLGLLVTGVVTVILWAVSRPFRRLTSMVSLTREQVGGFFPAAGTGTLGRALGRMRGPDSHEDSWWGERVERRRGGSMLRPEESGVDEAASGPRTGRTVRVDSEVLRPTSGASGSGGSSDGVPHREIDATRPALPAAAPRVPEVDGQPSQRIYRPSARRPGVDGRDRVVEGRVLDSRVDRGSTPDRTAPAVTPTPGARGADPD